jgi:UDP-GlcNAc:undecaprenyl-phosphate GlcNAc-1-phosphate transferase
LSQSKNGNLGDFHRRELQKSVISSKMGTTAVAGNFRSAIQKSYRSFIVIGILYSVIVSCVFGLVLTPLALSVAHRNKWFDPVNGRKIHSGNIPRLGGTAITLALTCGFSLISLTLPQIYTSWGFDVLWLGVCAWIIFLLGLADDFADLKARYKLVIQLAVAGALAWLGFRFDEIYLPFVSLKLGYFSYPVTIIWIVGVINAVNMIDGMDGLCGGISLIASASMGIIFLQMDNTFGALLCFSMVGAIAGYLFYNFPPAKIFMGDSGSTFLGFILAILPLIGQKANPSSLWFWDGFTVVLLPIFDTVAAILRRAKKGVSPMAPDKWHIHHKLMVLGLNVRSILAIVYTITMTLGVLTVSVIYTSPFVHFLIVIGGWMGLFLGFVFLHFRKERLIREQNGGN